MLLATINRQSLIQVDLACDECREPITDYQEATFTHGCTPTPGTPVGAKVVHKGACDRRAGRERFSHDGRTIVSEWAGLARHESDG